MQLEFAQVSRDYDSCRIKAIPIFFVYFQAMSDFKIMFPDMDRDVIEAVLRANQGAVDATIDQLLQMSTDNQVSGAWNSVFGNVYNYECFLRCV